MGGGRGGLGTALQRTGALALKGVVFSRSGSDALWDMAFEYIPNTKNSVCEVTYFFFFF